LFPRQRFNLEETVVLLCGLYRKRIELEGSLVWDAATHTALYESLTDGGISIRKARTFEALGPDRTRISERIDGRCPQAYLRKIVEVESRRSHRAHMESYHALFEKAAPAKG
jgi:hypothetical protein